MKLTKILRRFLVFPPLVTLWYLLRSGARVSPRAEVDLSRDLRLGKRSQISSFTKVKVNGGPLCIGRDVSIATGCFIGSGPGGTEIGDDCLIGPNVTISGTHYRYERVDVPFRLQGSDSKGIRIGRNVLLGAGTCVADGAEIGDGAIIAPNSLVTTRIAENGVAQGSPAKVIFIRR